MKYTVCGMQHRKGFCSYFTLVTQAESVRFKIYKFIARRGTKSHITVRNALCIPPTSSMNRPEIIWNVVPTALLFLEIHIIFYSNFQIIKHSEKPILIENVEAPFKINQCIGTVSYKKDEYCFV